MSKQLDTKSIFQTFKCQISYPRYSWIECLNLHKIQKISVKAVLMLIDHSCIKVGLHFLTHPWKTHLHFVYSIRDNVTVDTMTLALI